MKCNFSLSLSLLYCCKVETFSQKQSSRATVSVLDVKMGHTLLCVLGLFLLNTLLCRHAEGQNDKEESTEHSDMGDVQTGQNNVSSDVGDGKKGGDAILEIPDFTLFEGDSLTLRCRHQGTARNELKATFLKNGSSLQMATNHKSVGTEAMTIGPVTVSDRGNYKCQFDGGAESEPRQLKVEERRRQVTLTADKTIIPLGGSVTLTCSVEDPAGLKYEWFRQTSVHPAVQTSSQTGVNYTVITHGGRYTCRGWGREPNVITPESNVVTIQETVPNRPILTLQPNWPQIFSGETITLRCEIQGGGDTQWTYEWEPTSSNTQSPKHSEYRIINATESHSGDYRCKGRKDSYSSEWSNAIRLNVSAQTPKAQLRADGTDIPVGGSVTLTCSVNPSSSGWKYFLYRGEKTPEPLTTPDGVFLSTGQIRVSQGGLYWCRGGRGDSVYYTEYSDSISIYTILEKPVVTLQPKWSEIYYGEKITLRCEMKDGGHTEWTYEWKIPNLNTPLTNNAYSISRAQLSHSGDYSCKGRRDSYSSTDWSDAITLTVSSQTPKAQLRADGTDIPVGGSVTLTCSVNPSSSGWKYFWYRGEKTSEPLTTPDVVFLSTGQIRVSQGGLYWCRGERGDPVYYTQYSDSTSINNDVENKAVVTLQPNWSEIYRGEKITLRCEIKDGGDTEWTYEWKTTSSEKPSNQNEHSIQSATVSHSGEYRCKGRMKHDQQSSTDWSDPIKLTVFDKPQPVLTVSPLWLSPGDSVTLNCEVEHPSAGWRFYWYKAVPKISDMETTYIYIYRDIQRFYSYELLPGSSNGTEQDSYVVHGPTHTAGYMCRAGRGDPVYYTDYTGPEFVLSGDFPSQVSLTVSPDRAQHFTSDSVSLNCEGNSTQWRVRRFSENRYTWPFSQYCFIWGTMTGSTCHMYHQRLRDAVFWCESRSGEFSNAVNITTDDDLILVSPVHPVTEGDSVTLGCNFTTEQLLSNVTFYKNNKQIQNGNRTELKISAVSKSDEGFYHCAYSESESPQSWLSVKSTSSPFAVWLIVGILLILLLPLLLLCWYKNSKDTCCHRLIQSRRTNQSSATVQTVNQDENQQQVYSSLLHGDVCVYETIIGSGNTGRGEGTDNYRNAVPRIQLKHFVKRGMHDDPAESFDYSNCM